MGTVDLTRVRHGTPTDAPPLLIAHGLFGSARNWGAVAKRLSDAREVVAVDMRNHAGSPWDPSHGYEDLAADLAAVAGDRPHDVLGHSMGGKAAMVLALRDPDRVRKLVVADIAPVAYAHSQAHLVEALRRVDLSRVSRRSDAAAQLADVPEDGTRSFLLQSLDIGAGRWTLNLDVLEAEMPRHHGFPGHRRRVRGAGPVPVGRVQRLRAPGPPRRHQGAVPRRALRAHPGCGPLAPCGAAARVRGGGAGVPGRLTVRAVRGTQLEDRAMDDAAALGGGEALAVVDTPAVLIDLDVAERNVDRFQAHADAAGLTVRPHVKTHKLPSLAAYQMAAGAVGITCQKVGEAEAMADGGLSDILLTYNILGASKLDRLRDLADRVALGVVADGATVVDGLSGAFADAAPLRVLVECDTGAGRCGVQSPSDAAALARRIDAAPGLRFGGLMTYPPSGGEADVEAWLSEAVRLCRAAGLDCATVSTGGSPGLWRAGDVPSATEYRPGTYVYNDRSLVAAGVAGWADCALTVLATVVSAPTDRRAVIDAGSKVLTSDLMGLDGHGHVLGRDDLRVDQLSEEHGRVVSDGPHGLSVGDRLRIVPNHACVVTNMVDAVTMLRAGAVERVAPVAARGRVT